MPTNSYTNPGNYTWTAPFATKQVTATVIGGGASGYRDCDGDDEGGGGGGGGFSRSTRNFSAGQTLSINVASGGSSPSCDDGNNGGTSEIKGGPGNIVNVRATGGLTGTDDSGGGGGGYSDAGDTTSGGGSGSDDDDGQDGGGAGKASGNSGRCGNGKGGRGTNLSGSSGSCPGGRSGANYGAGGAGNDGGSAGSGAKGGARIEWEYHSPQINSYSVGNNYNTDGIPDANVSITWSTTYANSVSLNRGIGGVSNDGSLNVNTGLQSNANGTSPAQKTYTLTASGPGGTVTSTKTAKVKNDNTPSNGWTTSFPNDGSTGFNPGTQVTVTLGNLAGVDMPCTISTSGSGNAIGLGGSFSGSRNFNNGETVQLRTTTLQFNTSLSGVGSNATFGKTNTKTVSVTTPSGSFNVSIITKAPRIKEDFNYGDSVDNYPFEDIDLIANNPQSQITTPQITANNIEIAMEVKVDKPDAQVNINGGGWQNARSI